MALLLLSRTCNAPILRVSVLKQVSQKEIFRTFARRHILKKQARTPPTKSRIYKMASLLFSKACNTSALQIKILKQIASIRKQIFRTCVDEKPTDALHSMVSCRRILKEQAMAPPTDKSAEFYKITSLFSRVYNGLILRVKVLNQIPRIQIFRTFADKVNGLRTRISHKRIFKKQVMAPAKSKEINKMVSVLFSKVANVLKLRLKILQEISLKQLIGTFADKSKVTLHTSICRIPSLKEQALKTDKLTEINNMASLIFNKVSTVLILRFKILQQISPKQIFQTFTDGLNTLRTRVCRIRALKEQAITSATSEHINKLSPSLFRRSCNDLTLRFKVLKRVPRKQIFGTLTYESPISALRTSRYHRCTNTNKRPNIDKGALTIGSIGIGTLFFYNLGLLNQSDSIEIYVYFGCSIAVAVASAMAALYSPVIMNIVTRKGFMTQVINMAAIIGTGVVAHNIEYNPGFGLKQLAWLLYAGVVGIMFTPILIGPISRRAMHTTGVFVGLYVIAKCTPKETLYDPINEALSIFMEILNIFIRIAGIFAKVTNKNK